MNLKTAAQHLYFYLIVFLCPFFLASCAVNRNMSSELNKIFRESAILNDHFTGFAISAAGQSRLIYEKNSDLLFAPASNVKLFNLYAGLQLIPDSIPSLRYIERGDSLIFWGTGDPSFLHRRLQGTKAFSFLKSSKKKLFYAPGRYTGNLYGQGWAWDDYNDYYQAEITELPLIDNLIEVKSERGKLTVNPAIFSSNLKKDSLRVSPIAQTSLVISPAQTFKITRSPDQNEFHYPDVSIPANYIQLIPYKTSVALTLKLLSDTLQTDVGLIALEMPSSAKTIYNMQSDSVFREMMLPSDNFIAEQLLLVYANQFQLKLSSAETIQYILQKYLSALPDRPNWVDGSGLSRMNLFSPRDIIMLLQLIDKKVNDRNRLFSLLPAGGKSGTLKNAYPKTDQPFVFAKSGSFSNNYNQSGYVVTKKGRVFCFSFLNNNFIHPAAAVRKEITRVITRIHDKF